MSDLLHEALHRAAASASPPDVNRLSLADEGSLSPPTSPSAHGAALAGSDDELIPVRTPAFTTPGGSQATSVASTPDVSRPGSPTNEHGGPSTPGRRPGASSRKSGKGKPRRDKTKEREKAERNRLTRDPLVKFPHEISSRIFAALGEHDLATCMAVCKRWRRSQTINYSWYQLLQSQTLVPLSSRRATYSSKGEPTWTKRESEVDWAAEYRAIASGEREREQVQAREEEEEKNMPLSNREIKEQAWKEEDERLQEEMSSKTAMREYYKTLGNAKVRGKSGKGSAKTWE